MDARVGAKAGVVEVESDALDVRTDTCAVACHHRAKHRMVGSSPLVNKASCLLGAPPAWTYDDPYVIDADLGGVGLDGAGPGNRESNRRVDRQPKEDLE